MEEAECDALVGSIWIGLFQVVEGDALTGVVMVSTLACYLCPAGETAVVVLLMLEQSKI